MSFTSILPNSTGTRIAATLPSSEIIESLIHAGTLAPSPENNQPWHFTVHKDHLVLRYVTSRALRTDRKDVLNLLSLGAALENMKLQATVFGLAMIWRVEPVGPVPSIRIQFEKAKVDVDPLAHYISRRHTNRHPYSSESLSAVEVGHLRGTLPSSSEIRLSFFQSGSEKGRLGRVFRLFDQVRFSYRIFHAEMIESLNFSRREFRERRQGLGVHRLGLPFGGAHFLRILRSWSIFHALNFIGLSKIFARLTEQQLKNSGALIVISAPTMAVADLLSAGQAMQRVWLAATEKGLAVQPFGHTAIFQDLRADEDFIEKGGDREKVTQALSDLHQQLALDIGYLPVLTLRVGHAKTKMQAETIRFDLTETMTSPEGGK